MDVLKTKTTARSAGVTVRSNINKAARTAATAAQVGAGAVTGFLAGIFTGKPAKPAPAKQVAQAGNIIITK